MATNTHQVPTAAAKASVDFIVRHLPEQLSQRKLALEMALEILPADDHYRRGFISRMLKAITLHENNRQSYVQNWFDGKLS